MDEAKTVYVLVEGAGPADQGVFELTVLCDHGADPAIEDSCGYSYLTCGDNVKGSTRAPSPTLFTAPPDLDPPLVAGGGTTGDRTYLVAVDEATELVLSACASHTTVPVALFLFDGPPTRWDASDPRADARGTSGKGAAGGVSGNGLAWTPGGEAGPVRLLASTDPSAECGTLRALVPAAGAYYLVVRGATPEAVGNFELVAQCLPRPTPLSDCPYSYVGCGDVVVGSTLGHPTFLGPGPKDPARTAPDALFLVTVFEPTTVALTSCDAPGLMRARLKLFGKDALPMADNATLIATSTTASAGKPHARGGQAWNNGGAGDGDAGGERRGAAAGDCSTLVADLPEAGGYWLVVEGDLEGGEPDAQRGGLFELAVGCAPKPHGLTAPNETCSYSYATCGDTLQGTTRGFPDRFGARLPGGQQGPDGRPEQARAPHACSRAPF